jgi:hypothetical protein
MKPRKPMAQDAVLAKMAELRIPMTRDNYIRLAYFGEKTFDQLEGEELAELPDIWNEEGELIQ